MLLVMLIITAQFSILLKLNWKWLYKAKSLLSAIEEMCEAPDTEESI